MLMKKNNISRIQDIKEKLSQFLSKDRLAHSFRVANLSIALAKRYNENLYYAEVAGLLHDCAKDLEISQYGQYGISTKKIKNFDFILKNTPEIMHSFASKEFAKIEFGISNKYILQAIESHTVGNKNMSLLDKIVFVADMIEPARKTRGIGKIRVMAFKDIDTAVAMSFELVIKFLVSKHKTIFLDTILSWNNLISSENK
jgi:predicted HD superfamily hydrolase involved in NAD metabolism